MLSVFPCTPGLRNLQITHQIIPAFASVTRASPRLQEFRYQEFHLQQLAILVGIIKQHVRNYLPDIFGLIEELWENTALQLPIVSLIEALGKALNSEFKPFLASVLPPILKIFDGEFHEKRTNTQIKVFDAFLTFGANIEEYLHLVIPIIIRSFERTDASPALRKRAIQTIDGLSRRVNFSDHASRIIHPLVRVLENANNELRMAVMDLLCSLLIQLGSDFAIFVPMINKVKILNLLKEPHAHLPFCIVFTSQSHPTSEVRKSHLQVVERRTITTGYWCSRFFVRFKLSYSLCIFLMSPRLL
jgi:FKBP12-rapamycin complex-associated protein